MNNRVIYSVDHTTGSEERLVVAEDGTFYAEVICGLDHTGVPIWKPALERKVLGIQQRAILYLCGKRRPKVPYLEMVQLNERLVHPDAFSWHAEVISGFDAVGDPIWTPETNPAEVLRIHQRAVLHLERLRSEQKARRSNRKQSTGRAANKRQLK